LFYAVILTLEPSEGEGSPHCRSFAFAVFVSVVILERSEGSLYFVIAFAVVNLQFLDSFLDQAQTSGAPFFA
jgi:hypothetical protein